MRIWGCLSNMAEKKIPRNSKLRPTAQSLRREMTPQERTLWYQFLKNLNVTVNRQKVIGYYIVDFYCHAAKIVIELDGSQHYESEGQEHDRKRDRYLRELGLTVLRYSNRDMSENFRGVCQDILQKIQEKVDFEVRILER